MFFDVDKTRREIADWMRDVMARHRLSARKWAEMAKVGKDSVRRGLDPDYPNVTSTRTLTLLAEAVGETAPGAAGFVPPAETLDRIIRVIVSLNGGPDLADDAVAAIAQALRDTLLHLACDAEAANDPAQAAAVARSIARQPAR